jgi:hypothetical protein
MIWWFLILGVSALVVVCMAIALYMRLRRHLQTTQGLQEGTEDDAGKHQPGINGH